MPVNRAFWIEIIYRGILTRNCPPLVRLQYSFNLKYESSIKESQFIFGDWYSLVLSWALGLNEQTICRTGWYIYICYLLAGRSVWWKTVTEGLKMRPKVAGGRGQHFQARGHSFSPYGPTLSRQITCLFFSCSKLVLQPITNGFVYATLSLNGVARPKLFSDFDWFSPMIY